MSQKFSLVKTLSLSATLILSGCGDKAENDVAAIDQQHVCEVSAFGPATQCKAGQKLAFLPRSWGNEQLPILFAAINCDLRYTVAMNNGGVTCIYAPIKREEAKDKSDAPDRMTHSKP